MPHRQGHRLAQDLLERPELAACGPDLEFGVADGVHPQDRLAAVRRDLDIAHGAVAAAVQRLGQPQARRQRPDDAAEVRREVAVAVVVLLGVRAAALGGKLE